MAEQIKKRGDGGERTSVFLWGGLLTILLIVLDVTYSNFSGMRGLWLIGAAVGHFLVAASWVGTILSLKDPNLEYWRKILTGAAIATLLIVFFHRALWNDEKTFNEEVEQNKTEQLGN